MHDPPRLISTSLTAPRRRIAQGPCPSSPRAGKALLRQYLRLRTDWRGRKPALRCKSHPGTARRRCRPFFSARTVPASRPGQTRADRLCKCGPPTAHADEVDDSDARPCRPFGQAHSTTTRIAKAKLVFLGGTRV